MTGPSKLIAVGVEADDAAASHEETYTIEDTALAGDTGSEWADDDAEADDWSDEIDDAASPRGWLIPAFAALVIAAWTGFFGWVHSQAMLAGAPPTQWSDWVVSWAVPVLLVVAICLLAIRTSTREARRFGDTASMLSAESARLELRLTTVNRELSLAREFLAAETRELETLGRVAGAKLSEHAEHLQSLVKDNGAQVESIATVSATALVNMEKLRDDMPVVANSARDVSNQIGNAGRTAHGQLDDMVRGFERLNEFGQASENQVTALRGNIDEAITAFDARVGQMDELTTARFSALREQSEAFRIELDGREVEALADMRHRADMLHDEVGTARAALEGSEEEALKSLRARLGSLRDESATIGNAVREQEEAALLRWSDSVGAMKDRLAEAVRTLTQIDEKALDNSNSKLNALMLEAQAVDAKLVEREELFEAKLAERRGELDRDSEAAIESLDTHFAELDRKIGQRREAQVIAANTVVDKSAEITAGLEAFHTEIATIADQGEQIEKKLVASAERLASNLTESRAAIDGTDETIAQLTENSVRLLELVRGAAERSREDLPAALGDAEARLASLGDGAGEVRAIMAEAAENGRSLSDYLISSKDDGREAADAIAALHERLAQAGTDHAERLHALRRHVEELGEESDVVSARAQDNLKAAIAALEESVREASEHLTENTAQSINAFAERVGSETADAVEKALREKTEAGVAALEERSASAATVSREAAVQLRDQLSKVNELAGNLETRVNRARERAEEQIDNDFSRRVALITESLNSNAIDIAKALSCDVTDTAWAGYLRGDRGIFTRRAVKLIDNSEARDIAEVYDTDNDFREHVSRYIHDFEAMLRTMLSTRDGNALSVTLLSSDMGKLYVVLAQALDRLREE